jgi:GNAT superfamily N-acetyltransferase
VHVEVRPEPYDSEIAQRFVRALADEVEVRYAHDDTPPPDDFDGGGDYLSEVTAADLVAPHGVFVVAWIDGEAVACGALRRIHEGVGEIKRMYTAPSHRRQGASRAVLAALEREAAALGFQRLQLETGTAQPEAVALYEASGWQRIAPYGAYAWSPLSVCFAKDLRAGEAR